MIMGRAGLRVAARAGRPMCPCDADKMLSIREWLDTFLQSLDLIDSSAGSPRTEDDCVWCVRVCMTVYAE